MVAQTTMWATLFDQTLYLDDTYVPTDSLSSFHLRVTYDVTSVLDTARATTVKSRMLLEAGTGISKYYSYARFKLDSLLRTDPRCPVSRACMKIQLGTDVFPPDFYEAVYQNYPTGKTTVIGRIVATDFLYEEPLQNFEWRITPDTSSWNGLPIQKATCTFRGRDYEAWFCPDIPVPLGPWKFRGLPGLIVRVSDSGQQYCFEASRITNQLAGQIWMPSYHFRKCARKEYLKAKGLVTANYALYQRHYNNGTGIIISPPPGYKRKALGNDFIELE